MVAWIMLVSCMLVFQETHMVEGRVLDNPIWDAIVNTNHCAALYNATAAVMDSYVTFLNAVDDTQFDDPDFREHLLGGFGIDVFDNNQLKKLVCEIAESNTVMEIVQKLGPVFREASPSTITRVYNHLKKANTGPFKGISADIICYQAAKLWIWLTGFPKFPLDISADQLYESLDTLPWRSLTLIGLRGSDLHDTADILAESQTLDEFALRTGQTVDRVLRAVAEVSAIDELKAFNVNYISLLTEAENAGLFDLPLE